MAMEEKEAFKRKENWGKGEVDALVQAVADCRDLLTAKLSPSVTAERKAKTWERVALRVNAVSASSTGRTVKDIKKKWQSVQSQVKAKEVERRRVVGGTGGGPSPKDLTEMEKSALTIIPNVMVAGISGGLESVSGCYERSDGWQPSATNSPVQVEICEDLVTGKGDATGRGIHVPSNEGKKRKCQLSTSSFDHAEDYRARLLSIEERKLEIEEQKLVQLKEQTEALKEIAFVLQAKHVQNLLLEN